MYRSVSPWIYRQSLFEPGVCVNPWPLDPIVVQPKLEQLNENFIIWIILDNFFKSNVKVRIIFYFRRLAYLLLCHSLSWCRYVASERKNETYWVAIRYISLSAFHELHLPKKYIYIFSTSRTSTVDTAFNKGSTCICEQIFFPIWNTRKF